jgi:glycosyltransferase involved in cell wall biosynthesis
MGDSLGAGHRCRACQRLECREKVKIMSKPYVSVLIDTYNHKYFIEQAITSVLDQDMPMADVEIIVVDDGSTDCTPEIIRAFEPRVRLIRKQNGGQGSAFNAGIPECRGEIIAFLDGDDWWEKDKLRSVLEQFEANPEIGAVGNGLYEVNAEGQRQFVNNPDRPYRCFFHTVEEGLSFWELMSFMGTSRLAIRKAVLEKILPVPEALVIEADEYLATLAVAISGAIIIPRPLTNYRIHAGNLYQYSAFDPEKTRRKMRALETLVRDLPSKLRERNISEDVIETLFRGRRVEIERMRLGLDGGSPLRTFTVERTAYQISYREVTWRHRLFHAVVLAETLLLPPRVFYRLRRWYAERGLSRLRGWTGSPIPVLQITERRPELPNR